MALVVFLRGMNVGGHKTLRPTLLAKVLRNYDVVNIGAAGTFVVRKPGTRTNFRADLLRRLPAGSHVVLCDGRDLIRLETENPFAGVRLAADAVRFVSVLPKAAHVGITFPINFPNGPEWLVRLIGVRDQFVFGVYRRHMRTIGCLGQIDAVFGAPATTRNWNTIVQIAGILKAGTKTAAASRS